MIILRDLPKGTRLIERGGLVVEANREWMFEGVSGSNWGEIVFNVLNDPETPKVRDTLGPNFPYCRLVDRLPRIIAHNSTTGLFTVIVDFQYKWLASYIPESGPEPYPYPGGPISLGGGAVLNQITTRFENDYETPIEVSYIDSEDIQHDQKGEITVPEPRITCRRECLIATEDPEAIAGFWINKVNASPWKKRVALQDGEPVFDDKGNFVLEPCPAKTWLCTACEPKPVDITVQPAVYLFSFEFEYKPEIAENKGGHVYTLAYVDSNGEVPDDVEFLNGIEVIDWHKTADFGKLFAF